MKVSLVLLLASGWLGLLTGRACGCWKGIDPQAFAGRCPVIVTGTITRIDPGCPTDDPCQDTAHITVSAVHKSLLGDLPVRAGGEVRVRMSARHARARKSTDLSYPVGTRALWLLELRADGWLHIDTHPVQRQPVDTDREVTRGELVEVSGRRGGGAGTYTRAEWVARVKADREGQRDHKQRSDRKQRSDWQAAGARPSTPSRLARHTGTACSRRGPPVTSPSPAGRSCP